MPISIYGLSNFLKENEQVENELRYRDQTMHIRKLSKCEGLWCKTVGINIHTVETVLTKNLRFHRAGAKDSLQWPEAVLYEILIEEKLNQCFWMC